MTESRLPCGDIRCLWHSMPRLHAAGNAYVSGIHLDVIMTWIERELAAAEEKVAEETATEDAVTSQTGKVMADEAVTLQARKEMSNDIKRP